MPPKDISDVSGTGLRNRLDSERIKGAVEVLHQSAVNHRRLLMELTTWDLSSAHRSLYASFSTALPVVLWHLFLLIHRRADL